MITSLPNILTLSRIGAIPAIVALFWVDSELTRWVMLGLYTFACLTDFFDGYAARSMGAISNFGKFLDPVADKLLVARSNPDASCVRPCNRTIGPCWSGHLVP